MGDTTEHLPFDTIPGKCGGRPCLAGTRMGVPTILAELAAGNNLGQLADNFDLDLVAMVRLMEWLAYHANELLAGKGNTDITA